MYDQTGSGKSMMVTSKPTYIISQLVCKIGTKSHRTHEQPSIINTLLWKSVCNVHIFVAVMCIMYQFHSTKMTEVRCKMMVLQPFVIGFSCGFISLYPLLSWIILAGYRTRFRRLISSQISGYASNEFLWQHPFKSIITVAIEIKVVVRVVNIEYRHQYYRWYFRSIDIGIGNTFMSRYRKQYRRYFYGRFFPILR